MLPYIGGKFHLASWIISHFPKNYKEMTYVEPFGGAGWVLFKKQPSKVEVYNDLNKDLVNLFRQIRDNYDRLSWMLYWTLHSRDMYYESLKKLKNRDFKDDIERAYHTAVVYTQCFRGKAGAGWAYHVKRVTSSRAFLNRLPSIRERLSNVQIECRDFQEVIETYDSENTLFYIDPPYFGKEKEYPVEFTEKDHIRLYETLKEVKGKWLLSYYPHPKILELYKDYVIHERQTVIHSKGITKNSRSKERPKVKEILIMNYEPESCGCEKEAG